MNRTKLKNYAPQARREFIQAVTDRAAFYGLTDKKIEPITENGDVAIIGGRAFPRAIASKRKALEERIAQYGFGQTMDAIAYTWFNRLVAIRYMELHGYLDHGYRVLTHPDASKSIPEILEQAEHLDLPGLDKHKVIELKLEGSKEAELYRMLLLAQCNALYKTMPFLFEWIGDETELLFPDNLLHTDSLIRKLVTDINEEDWQEVEIIGWLYQFYIAERKDEVMARKSAVPTEDIPAVTQLFTPHWIVRYLVENSLGRLWLLNRPGSRLRQHMPYYIEGEAETNFLKISKPEEIRLLDPACGSGHMLTYAFDLLFRIYEEEGYVPNEISALILKHNLYGLEICPRAAQLAELALVFKAREKSRRFFQPGTLIQPHIVALQNIRFDEGELRDYIAALELGDLFNQPMLQLLHQFEQATTFGSLIQPCLDEQNITFARNMIVAKDLGGQLFLRETHGKVLRLLEQAEMLCQRYHVVVANPPYFGPKQMDANLKTFAKAYFPNAKTDLYAMFIERAFSFAQNDGHCAFVTMQSWMFLQSFEAFRVEFLSTKTILSMAHLGTRAFDTISGEIVSVTAFCCVNAYLKGYQSTFFRLIDGNEAVKDEGLRQQSHCYRHISQHEFKSIPGSPIAYWIGERLKAAFQNQLLSELTLSDGQNITADNEQFVRNHWELSASSVGRDKKWLLYAKGGPFRRWYGNLESVVNWSPEARTHYRQDSSARIIPEYLWYRQGITWSRVGTALAAFRLLPENATFDKVGSSVFLKNDDDTNLLLGLLNSSVAQELLDLLNPSIDIQVKDVRNVPLPGSINRQLIEQRISPLVIAAKADWDNFETSWDFHDLPLLRSGTKGATLAASWEAWRDQCTAAIRRMQELETENNRLFIEAYGLTDELKPEVPEEQITLAHADHRKDMAAFLSYAVGCMMGRYSLDKHGLIHANAGATLHEYLTKVGHTHDSLIFTPDEDGIIPVLDGEWFEDDVVARAQDFLRATFGEATLGANLHFIEESLGKGLRKYFQTDFYKDHLQTYKKRPIYWLFSSGKERAFQCLVYLHRYQEGTLARIRTEYVIPLQGKMAARIEQLASETQKASSTSQRKTLEKERDKLLKQQTELRAFDEKLRHYADQRITLDLDDGVKVNYGKFGDLLAEVKAVAGGTDEN